ncbi:MAG: hypothetical protein WA777_02790 [Rhodanobacter sp.]
MRPHGDLTQCPRPLPPSSAAQVAIEQIQRCLAQGCSELELAQARAALDAMNQPRQSPQLQLVLTVLP